MTIAYKVLNDITNKLSFTQQKYRNNHLDKYLMLKDIRDIKIQGANFEVLTQLPLFCEKTDSAKAVILYGRNGSGKSTIARSFRRVKGVPAENIHAVSVLDGQGAVVTLRGCGQNPRHKDGVKWHSQNSKSTEH